jgi:hypothetical protein
MLLELDTQSGEIRRPGGQPLPVLRIKEHDLLPTTISTRPGLPVGATVAIWFAPVGSRVGIEAGAGDVGTPFILTVPSAGKYVVTVTVFWSTYRITSRDLVTTVEEEIIPNSEE